MRPTKKNGGNKNMAKKSLKKAKKLEATKPLTRPQFGPVR
jgi:hypothetical protein